MRIECDVDRSAGIQMQHAAIDQHLHRFAPIETTALEIGRHHEADADLAAAQRLHQLIRAVGFAARGDHTGGDHVLHQRARGRAVRLVGNTRIKMAQVEVDRIAEQQQLHRRNADDHRQRAAVAAAATVITSWLPSITMVGALCTALTVWPCRATTASTVPSVGAVMRV
ncbi:hypothetical protein G6F32_014860 [Rhizopus arrhizus]|nr:hypothetical protein G6F32_014860 [Rhizopus arrhizus]